MTQQPIDDEGYSYADYWDDQWECTFCVGEGVLYFGADGGYATFPCDACDGSGLLLHD